MGGDGGLGGGCRVAVDAVSCWLSETDFNAFIQIINKEEDCNCARSGLCSINPVIG